MAYIVTSCTYMYFKSRNYWYINFALPVIILLEIKWPITSNHLVNSSWLSKPSTSGTFEFGRCVNFPVSSSLSSLSSEGTSCVERLCSFGEDLIICINVRVEVLLIKINTTLELQMKEKATYLSQNPWIPVLAALKEACNDANNPDFLRQYTKRNSVGLSHLSHCLWKRILLGQIGMFFTVFSRKL